MAACPHCGGESDGWILAQAAALYPPVVRLIRRRIPDWQPQDGLCPACAQTFAEQLNAERSAGSLHLTTHPPGAFPYYHPDEETVLSQPQRLPAYSSITGAGVTIAFLDSGYYPHPDLAATPTWPDAPAWAQLAPRELEAILSAAPLRLAHYVDLTGDSRHEGWITPSLWDEAGDSWHGQMTTVIAAGNGLLSEGHFRGYAPGARLLPIKIGRAGGRIPEEDILCGLQWLLEEDRFAAYGVRVLNVSVGGDYEQPWQENPVCLAAEELVRRGVFVAAAAGNSGARRLLAPAQAPSVLTVGGVDDLNRRWSPADPEEVKRLALYPHNYGVVQESVEGQRRRRRKPELLGLARWLPSPILLPSPVLRETVAIARLRESLLAGDEERLAELAAHWVHALHHDPLYRKRHPGENDGDWRAEIEQALRKRMNAHKWVHAYYQHVDGTSVAVAQASAVAAQMVAANPCLSPGQIKALLMQTALPLRHLPRARTGAGLIQPTRAVAAALRAAGGPLAGLPSSATTPRRRPDAPLWGESGRLLYVGLLAPSAEAVSVLGPFNGWRRDATPLARCANGWWHGHLRLPPGRYPYRFWAAGGAHGSGEWLPDPENPLRAEGGYVEDHSLLVVRETTSDAIGETVEEAR
ncbi:MAG TPA: S8 family serine peptidase [Caldilineaceae bacterium]|nr:S8 family serine peptidase [Caldilineaceae bacterium]